MFCSGPQICFLTLLHDFGAFEVVIVALFFLHWCMQQVPDATMMNEACHSTRQSWNMLPRRASLAPPLLPVFQSKPNLSQWILMKVASSFFIMPFPAAVHMVLLKASLKGVQSKKELQWQKSASSWGILHACELRSWCRDVRTNCLELCGGNTILWINSCYVGLLQN